MTDLRVLFNPVQVGPYYLSSSIVAAPMTRCCADPQTQVPTSAMVEYYQNRKGVLHIAEGACVTTANAYEGTPGIYNQAQVEGWRKIADAVHANGDRLFIQLWHPGMMAHSSIGPVYQSPQAPSTVKPLKTRVPRSEHAYETPHALSKEEIVHVQDTFIEAAKNAMKAGLDGVEIHGASGYLVNEFLTHSTNRRTDEYGGTSEKMCRFTLEIIDRIGQEIGYGKVGIRLSPVPLPSMGDPGGQGNFLEDKRDQDVYKHLLAHLQQRQIAYVHACSDNEQQDQGLLGKRVSEFVREHY